MSTKLIAAELATAAGVTTVIMRSSNVDNVMEIIDSDENSKDEDVPLCTRFIRKENRLAE
jgi:glutamate 5-kinase